MVCLRERSYERRRAQHYYLGDCPHRRNDDARCAEIGRRRALDKRLAIDPRLANPGPHGIDPCHTLALTVQSIKATWRPSGDGTAYVAAIDSISFVSTRPSRST